MIFYRAGISSGYANLLIMLICSIKPKLYNFYKMDMNAGMQMMGQKIPMTMKADYIIKGI